MFHNGFRNNYFSSHNSQKVLRRSLPPPTRLPTQWLDHLREGRALIRRCTYADENTAPKKLSKRFGGNGHEGRTSDIHKKYNESILIGKNVACRGAHVVHVVSDPRMYGCHSSKTWALLME